MGPTSFRSRVVVEVTVPLLDPGRAPLVLSVVRDLDLPCSEFRVTMVGVRGPVH